MKDTALIPFVLIDALSFGPLPFYVHLLQIWLYRQRSAGAQTIVLPEPRDSTEAFSLGVASVTIVKMANHMGLGVIMDSMLQKHGPKEEAMLTLRTIHGPFSFKNIFQLLQLNGTAQVVSHFN